MGKRTVATTTMVTLSKKLFHIVSSDCEYMELLWLDKQLKPFDLELIILSHREVEFIENIA